MARVTVALKQARSLSGVGFAGAANFRRVGRLNVSAGVNPPDDASLRPSRKQGNAGACVFGWAAAVLLLTGVMTSVAAQSRENPAQKLLSELPEELDFSDCISLTGHLVDIDPKAGFKANAEKIAHRVGPSSGVRDSRAVVALRVAADHNAQSILELGLIDTFAPVFLVADKKREQCERGGCKVCLVQRNSWSKERV